ncbi:hypothetical protein PENSPDRAFT_757797 [Peniophora sp. CONT]|nr:hypothetical protein PENSPDRAFT_757797 [Peniophora sp. CONT]
MDELIPDFEVLLSNELSLADYDDLEPFVRRILDPVYSTLRAVSQDPGLLSRSMLDYLNLMRDSVLSDSRDYVDIKTRKCVHLAIKHADLIAAAKALRTFRAYQLMRSGKGSIHALPVEVLSLIFVSLTIRPESRYHSRPLDMKFRLVCRSWRHTIDNTPQLWAHVRLGMRRLDSRRLETFLHRSKGYPLELQIKVLLMTYDLLPILQAIMSRTRLLAIDCDPWGFIQGNWTTDRGQGTEVVRQFLSMPAPSLEILEISGIALEGEVFSNTAPPKLHTVLLDRCRPVSPTSCFFSSPLTSLSVDDCMCWQSIDEMLAVITKLPKLRDLTWVDENYRTAPPFLNPAAYHPKSLPLHQLEHLELNMDFESIIRIVPILVFPTSTTVTVSSFFAQVPTAGTPQFTALLEDFVWRSNRAFGNQPDREESGFGVVLESPTFDERGSSPPATFDFSACQDMECQDEFMLLIEQILSWPGVSCAVTNIEMEHPDYMRQDSHWEMLLRALPAITTVDVTGPAAAYLSRALYVTESETIPPMLYGLAWNLQTIILKHVGPRVVAVLCQMLESRAEHSLPRLELKLRCCEIDCVTLGQLRLHRGIHSVEWDGRQEGLIWGDYHDHLDSDEDSE